MKERGARVPHLAAILVGNDGGSETYVSHKVKDCEEVGFQVDTHSGCPPPSVKRSCWQRSGSSMKTLNSTA
ncbi:MAG: hypothetical protein MZV63_22940 [Marinilabiliales bacterium]|nr:hypothetical protein [Marinilabiliales bacterium]